MTQIPSDDILEGLYKLRIRESEKLWLWQFKDTDKIKYLAEFTNKEFWSQKLKLWQTPWSRIKRQKKKKLVQRSPGDCWQLKATMQCSKRDNCIFRHDVNRRAKPTQLNLSPISSTQQSEKNASRTRSPRGRSPSGRMARLPRKGYLKGTCTTPYCEVASSRMLVPQVQEWLKIWWKMLMFTSPSWRTA